MRFFKRTRKFVRTTGVILLRGAVEYNLGKTDREIQNLEERKEIYQGIRTALEQLFGHAPSYEDDFTDRKTNENMH
jgi:hypothetical protein